MSDVRWQASLVVCELLATHDPTEVRGIFQAIAHMRQLGRVPCRAMRCGADPSFVLQDRHASNASGPWGAPRFVVLFDLARPILGRQRGGAVASS